MYGIFTNIYPINDPVLVVRYAIQPWSIWARELISIQFGISISKYIQVHEKPSFSHGFPMVFLWPGQLPTPSPVRGTVIDWFQPWPMDALYNVGAKFLEPIEQLGPLDRRVTQ